MTFKILNLATNKLIDCSNVRAVDDPSSINLRADYLIAPEVVKSLRDNHPRIASPLPSFSDDIPLITDSSSAPTTTITPTFPANCYHY